MCSLAKKLHEICAEFAKNCMSFVQIEKSRGTQPWIAEMLGHKVWADVLDFYVLVIDWGQNVISLFHFFSVCGKRVGMPINKGMNALLRVWKTFEVRY